VRCLHRDEGRTTSLGLDEQLVATRAVARQFKRVLSLWWLFFGAFEANVGIFRAHQPANQKVQCNEMTDASHLRCISIGGPTLGKNTAPECVSDENGLSALWMSAELPPPPMSACESLSWVRPSGTFDDRRHTGHLGCRRDDTPTGMC
jgi:hypothetical protein